MGSSLSIPVLRLGLWPLMEQVVGISAFGLLAAVILNNLVELRRNKALPVAQDYCIGAKSHKSRSLVSGSMPCCNATEPDLEIGIPVSAASHEVDSASIARSIATLLTSNCASKEACGSRHDGNNSMSQIISEMDVLEMIPQLDTPNTVVSGFWHEAGVPMSPGVSVVSNAGAAASGSVITSRSVLTGKHTIPEIRLSRSGASDGKQAESTMVPREVNIPEKLHPLDESIQSSIDNFKERALMAHREELLEIGESLFVVGEMLQVSGRVDEALQVLQRAEFAQKRAVEEVIEQVAVVMHREGVKLRDRGNVPHLAMTLLGASELLKSSPTATNLRACSRVHFDYRSNFERNHDMKILVNELDVIFDVVSNDANALAQTLRAQAVCHRNAC